MKVHTLQAARRITAVRSEGRLSRSLVLFRPRTRAYACTSAMHFAFVVAQMTNVALNTLWRCQKFTSRNLKKHTSACTADCHRKSYGSYDSIHTHGSLSSSSRSLTSSFHHSRPRRPRRLHASLMNRSS
jgi:hypothetical protein